MFLESDGREPLGVDGSVRTGWWKTLEEGLRVAGSKTLEDSTGWWKKLEDSRQLSANCTRLFSLAADEILASQTTPAKLPQFLVRTLSAGPAWVCLLRLYMKHERLDDSV